MSVVSYAQALYSLAVEENCANEVYEQIEVIKFAFLDNPTLGKILDRPCVDKADQVSFIDRCFKGVNIHLLNCIKVMSKHRVTAHFPQMADEFIKLYRIEEKIESVTIITAVELSDEQRDKLKAKLETKLGKKIIMHTKLDPRIMGGVIVRTESKQIDDTIKSRLDNIGKKISSSVI